MDWSIISQKYDSFPISEFVYIWYEFDAKQSYDHVKNKTSAQRNKFKRIKAIINYLLTFIREKESIKFLEQRPDDLEEYKIFTKDGIKIGVAGMIVPSMTIAEAMECLTIYGKFNTKEFKIRTTIGIHPYTANEFNTTNNTINEMKNIILENPCITAIGECGLDYSDGFPDKSIQLPCFEEQLKLSCELKMPLYIHHRGAFDDFVDLMDKYHDRLNDVKILIHCFTGDEKELEWILNQPNYFISFSGYICKPKHGEILRKLLIQQRKDNNKNKKLLKRMMIETDAPYLGFPNCRMYTNGNAKSKRKQYPNVPTSLPYIVKTLSTCLNIDEETIAIETKKNAEMFFNIVG